MGYIDLTCPVTHLWYLKGVPNYLCVLLKCIDPKITVSHIEQIVYFKEGERIINSDHPLYSYFYPTENNNELKNFLGIGKNIENLNSFKPTKVQKRRGAEIIKAALESINLKSEIKKTRSLVDNNSIKNINSVYIPDKTIIRRIRILESFLATKTNPSWMILTTLPVLPPNLRPLLELESGRLVAADVNEIYRLIITRNQRLYDFMYQFIAPDLITVHSRKLLQEGGPSRRRIQRPLDRESLHRVHHSKLCHVRR